MALGLTNACMLDSLTLLSKSWVPPTTHSDPHAAHVIISVGIRAQGVGKGVSKPYPSQVMVKQKGVETEVGWLDHVANINMVENSAEVY